MLQNKYVLHCYYTIKADFCQLIKYFFHQLNIYYVLHYLKGGLDMVDLGNKLKSLRLQHNMTQAQLAQKLGLTKSVISAYETGLRMPSYDILIHITKIFKVSSDYLLGIESRQDIDLSGLSNEEVSALLNLIKAMQKK